MTNALLSLALTLAIGAAFGSQLVGAAQRTNAVHVTVAAERANVASAQSPLGYTDLSRS